MKATSTQQPRQVSVFSPGGTPTVEKGERKAAAVATFAATTPVPAVNSSSSSKGSAELKPETLIPKKWKHAGWPGSIVATRLDYDLDQSAFAATNLPTIEKRCRKADVQVFRNPNRLGRRPLWNTSVKPMHPFPDRAPMATISEFQSLRLVPNFRASRVPALFHRTVFYPRVSKLQFDYRRMYAHQPWEGGGAGEQASRWSFTKTVTAHLQQQQQQGGITTSTPVATTPHRRLLLQLPCNACVNSRVEYSEEEEEHHLAAKWNASVEVPAFKSHYQSVSSSLGEVLALTRRKNQQLLMQQQQSPLPTAAASKLLPPLLASSPKKCSDTGTPPPQAVGVPVRQPPKYVGPAARVAALNEQRRQQRQQQQQARGVKEEEELEVVTTLKQQQRGSSSKPAAGAAFTLTRLRRLQLLQDALAPLPAVEEPPPAAPPPPPPPPEATATSSTTATATATTSITTATATAGTLS